MTSFAFSGCCGTGPAAKKPVLPKVVAHRGFSYVAPENTLAAIRLAWEVGSPGAECDVYLTRDNRIMLLHDKTTKRTAGVDKPIAEMTSDELRQLDAGSWKDQAYAGERIPFLEEVIETIPEGRVLFIEVKCGPEIVPFLKTVVEQSGKRERLAIICFNMDVCVASKKAMPSVPVYFLSGTRKEKETGHPIPHDPALVDAVVEKGLDGLDVHYAGLDKTFADRVLEADLKLFTWTVNDAEEARRNIGLGVHGITTDRPDYIMEQLGISH